MSEMLKLERVSKHFGGLAAVRELDFEVRAGEILGLIGPNGAGKTTVFNVISGMHRPSEGRVLFKGENVAGLRPSAIVRLGLVRTFQATMLFATSTVFENVMRGAFVRTRVPLAHGLLGTGRARAELARATARVDALLALLGLDRYRDVAARNLPYGHQRRLGVAIALATEPELLLLDEPAAGLNPEESVEMGQLIERIHREQGITVLLVEHHMRLVMGLCHRIVVLDHGIKIAEGAPAEIQRHPAVIEAYLGSDDDADP